MFWLYSFFKHQVGVKEEASEAIMRIAYKLGSIQTILFFQMSLLKETRH